jgi:uncharacterized protein YhdP
VRLGADLLPLGLRHVQGRVGAQWQNNEVEISSQDLVFDTREGEHWPGGVLRVGWRGDAFEVGTLNADRLDLDALAQISQRLPLPEALRAMLSRVQPQGQVNQLKATWHTNNDASLNYTARGQVRQLSMLRDTLPESPLANLPGMQAAQLEFDLTQKGGKARGLRRKTRRVSLVAARRIWFQVRQNQRDSAQSGRDRKSGETAA